MMRSGHSVSQCALGPVPGVVVKWIAGFGVVVFVLLADRHLGLSAANQFIDPPPIRPYGPHWPPRPFDFNMFGPFGAFMPFHGVLPLMVSILPFAICAVIVRRVWRKNGTR